MATEPTLVKLQIRRGAEALLPLLNEGEMAVTTDTSKFYVGTGAENLELGRADVLENLEKQLNLITNAASIDPAVERMKVGGSGRTYASARDMVIGESKSSVVNVVNPLLANELPGAYPVGITSLEIGSSDFGYPDALGTATTIKLNDYRITQVFTSKVTARTWVRAAGESGGWGNWAAQETTAGAQKKADEAKQGAINWAKEYGLGTEAKEIRADLNTAQDSGFFRFSRDQAAVLNAPKRVSGEHAWMYMIVIKHSSEYVIQLVWDFSAKSHYVRTLVINTWSDWKLQESEAGSQKRIEDTLAALGVGVNANNQYMGSVDFNDSKFYNSGIYRVSGTTTLNGPVTNFSGQLIVARGGGDTVAHIAIAWADSSMWYRGGNPINTTSGKWSEWKKALSLAEIQKEINLTQVYKLTDDNGDWTRIDTSLDNLKKSGNYFATSGTPMGYGFVTVSTGSGRVIQTFMHDTSLTIYKRHLSSTGWGTWEKAPTFEDLGKVTTDKINIVTAKPSTDIVDSYKQGLTSFSISSDGSTNPLAYPFNFGLALNVVFNKNRALQIAADKEQALYFRIGNEVLTNQWSEFIKIATTKDVNDLKAWVQGLGLGSTGVIAIDGQDLDLLITSGNYRGGNMKNAPMASTLHVEVFASNSNSVTQKVHALEDNRMFFRAKTSGSWTAWKEVATI
jgi:Major tropism determinant N-terminal domain